MTSEGHSSTLGRASVGVGIVCAITCSCSFLLITVFAQPLVVGSLPILLTERLHRLLFDRQVTPLSGANTPARSHKWKLEATVAALLVWLAVMITTAIRGFHATNQVSFVVTYDLPVVIVVAVVGVWASIRYARTAILATVVCCICSLVLMLLVETPFEEARLQPLVEGVGLAPILLIDPIDQFFRSGGRYRDGHVNSTSRSRLWGLKALALAAILYGAYTVAGIVSIIVFVQGPVKDIDPAQSARLFSIIIVIALLMGFWAAWRYGRDDVRIVWTACVVTALLPFVLGAGVGRDFLYVLASIGSWCLTTMGASWVGCVLARRLMAGSVRAVRAA